MRRTDLVLIMAGVVITLAFFALLGYVVYLLRTSSGPQLAVTLTALATGVTALSSVLYALRGSRAGRPK